MTLTKRSGLGALLVVAAALFTSTPALAQSTITLTNTADSTDRDSGALGQATLTDVAYSYSYEEVSSFSDSVCDVYTCYLTVSCSGLTPGATYRIGPTGIQSVFGKKIRQPYCVPTYSSVRASRTGTVELALQVSFVGSRSRYSLNQNYGGYWEFVGFGYSDYSLSVDRKDGSKYTPVLQGSFPHPADPN